MRGFPIPAHCLPLRSRRLVFPRLQALLWGVPLCLAACGADPTQLNMTATLTESLIFSTSNMPVPATVAQTAAQTPAAAAAAARIAAGLEAQAAARRGPPTPPGAPRLAPASAAALLQGAPEGRAFLAMTGPRALAVGEPPAACPARAAAAGSGPVAAAEAALRACLGQLAAARAAGPDCGCRTLALGGAALAPLEAFAYAPGVSARLISDAAGLDLTLVATEDADPDGTRLLRFHPSPGDGPAEARIAPDGAVRLTLGRDLWQGTRTADGMQRGRLRERLVLTRPDGARLVVAVGWEPEAFALARDRLLAPGG